MRRPLPALAGLILLSLFVAGCTAEQRLKTAYDSATAVYNEAFDARDAGLITQADVDRDVRPVRADTDKAFGQAESLLAAGNVTAMDATLAFIAKRLIDLRPLLNAIDLRRLGQQKASP